MSPSDSPRKPPNAPRNSYLRVVPSAPVDQHATNHTHSNEQLKHIICLVILPFNGDQSFDYYKEILLPALRSVFERAPYYWQIAYAQDNYYHADAVKNIEAWRKHAKMYLVDISADNVAMHIELAHIDEYIKAKRGIKPLLFALCREGTECTFGLRREIPLLHYPVGDSRRAIEDFSAISNDRQNAIKHAIEDVSEKLKEKFQRRDVRTFNDSKKYHYLSISVLNEELSWHGPPADACADEYVTMEDFIMANESEVALRLLEGWGIKLRSSVIREYQQAIRDMLGV